MKLLFRLQAVLIGLLAGLLCACEPSSTIEGRTQLLAANAQYFAPSTPGPAPLVILMSGCGGVIGSDGKPNRIMENYAKAAARSGAYAIIVDSFRPRGIGFEKAVTTVCTGVRLRGRARAGDALAAESLARTHWNVEFTGVVLSGWSHGAWAIMELLAAGPEGRKLGPLEIEESMRAQSPDAVTLFYPYCGILNRSSRKPWSFQGPILLVMAGLDTIGRPETCTRLVEKVRPGMGDVESVTFPGETHAFDEESQSKGSAFIYDPEAAAKSEAIFSEFIAEQVSRLK